jgi:nucleoside-diphosphate-sugar epimerase
MRLVHVDSAADALARALTSESAAGRAVNVVDDDPLTYGAFHRLLTAGTDARRLPVPWTVVRLAGWSAARANAVLFGGRGRLPEILSSSRQIARWAPLRYPNDLARDLLGWTPRPDTAARVAALAAAVPPGSAAVPRGARP